MLCLASILSFWAASWLLWLAQRALSPPADVATVGLAYISLLACLLCAAVAYVQERRRGARAKRPTGAVPLYVRSLSLALVGLALYAGLQHLPADMPWGLLRPLVQAVAPALLALGAVPALAQAWALWRMRLAPIAVPEPWRIRAAGRAAHIVVLSCITFAAVNWASLTYNRKWDLSYFKVTQASPRTRALVQSLEHEVGITLFFPPGNDVLEQLRGYVAELAPLSPWLSTAVLDQAQEPGRSRELRVRRNGIVVVHSGKKMEQLPFDVDVEQSRGALRRLDTAMYRALRRVTAPQSIVYVTDGHNERTFDKLDTRALPGLLDFKALLEDQGFELQPLGLTEGLATAIPDDAAAVAIMGPTQVFSSQELQTLRRYMDHGGHLLLCLDPDRDDDHGALAALAHVDVSRAKVGNPHYQVRAANQGPSPFNLVTVRAAGHPSVHSLEAHPGRLGVILLGAGAITAAMQPPPGVQFTPTVRAMPDSFVDANNNGRQDADEPPQQNIVLGMAVQWPATTGEQEARAVVFGDIDALTDGTVRNVGNTLAAGDAVQWLTGSAVEASLPSEDDVPLVHRKDADALWFDGVSFGVPLVVFALGLALHERDRKRLRRSA